MAKLDRAASLTMREMAIKALRMAGAPMSAIELWRFAEQKRITPPTTAEKPWQSLSALLYRDKKETFIHVGSGPVRYWLSERTLPKGRLNAGPDPIAGASPSKKAKPVPVRGPMASRRASIPSSATRGESLRGADATLTPEERTIHSLITIKAWTGLPRRGAGKLECCMFGRHEGAVQRHHQEPRADLFRELMRKNRISLKPTDPIRNVLEALRLHQAQLKGIPTVALCRRHEKELREKERKRG